MAHCAGHVGRDLVEVVEAHELARRVQVVAPRQPLDVRGLEEELVREPERVFDAHRVADALHEPLGAALDAASELGVEGDRTVEVVGRPHAVAEGGDCRDRAPAQHQVVVDELLGRAQVDRLVVFVGDVEAQHVDVELAGGREVGHHELHVRATQDVGGRGRGRRDGVLGVDGGFGGDVEPR